MKIEKAALAQKISKLKSVVPKKTTTPVLQGILVQDGYLVASNMELTVRAKIEGADRESFIIPAKAFDLINNLPDGDIEITTEQKAGVYSITIRAAKIKNKCQTLDPSTFPMPNTEDEGGGEFAIKSAELLTSMRRVSYAILESGTNPQMCALCLQAAEGTLNFAGMNRRMLAWDKLDFKGKFELLVPKSTVEKLLSIGISGEVSIKYNTVGAVFICNEYEIQTRIVSGEYFKYQSIFKELRLHTVVSRMELLEAMTRVKMCTEGKCPVKFVLDGSTLSLSIKERMTDYEETLGLQEEISEPLTIAFDASLVLETLKAFDCDNVGISCDTPKMPMIIEAEDSDFKAVVLPVVIS